MTKKFVMLAISMTLALMGYADAGPSATGHIEITFGPPASSTNIQYSFVAHALKDGVQGQAEIAVSFLAGAVQERFHLDVDCLTVVTPPPPVGGSIASIGGIVTNVQSQSGPVTPFPEGRRIFFRVQDNGEGANDPPDRASGITSVLGNPPPVICQILAAPPSNSEAGNVQVRP